MIVLALEEESRLENPSIENVIKNTKLYAKKTVKKITKKEIMGVLGTSLLEIYFK
jgi:hypothetical protein